MKAGKKAKPKLLSVAQIDLNTIPDELKDYLEIEYPTLSISDMDTIILRAGCLGIAVPAKRSCKPHRLIDLGPARRPCGEPPKRSCP